VNPDKTIKPWLLAIGEQWGIKMAWPYRAPDIETRQIGSYFVYKPETGAPATDGHQNMDTSTGYDVNRRRTKQHYFTYRIELHGELGGLEKLLSCAVAADSIEEIKLLFYNGGCEFVDVLSATDETPTDRSDDLEYMASMIVRFTLNVEGRLEVTNGVVETLELKVSSDTKTYHITSSGYLLFDGTYTVDAEAGDIDFTGGTMTVVEA
jgi:hypothetical protein